jgi:hypothetical protein
VVASLVRPAGRRAARLSYRDVGGGPERNRTGRVRRRGGLRRRVLDTGSVSCQQPLGCDLCHIRRPRRGAMGSHVRFVGPERPKWPSKSDKSDTQELPGNRSSRLSVGSRTGP